MLKILLCLATELPTYEQKLGGKVSISMSTQPLFYTLQA